MPERTTADTLAARLAEGAADVGELAGKSVTVARDAIAYARALEGAASAAEASRDRALDERDAAVAAYEAERDHSTTIAELRAEIERLRRATMNVMYQRDLAESECERLKADEERPNAGLVKALEQSRALARRYERERQDLMASEERLTAALREIASIRDDPPQPAFMLARSVARRALGDG